MRCEQCGAEGVPSSGEQVQPEGECLSCWLDLKTGVFIHEDGTPIHDIETARPCDLCERVATEERDHDWWCPRGQVAG